MARKIKNVADIRDWRLCVGCGACVSACQSDSITLTNRPELGIRPVVDQSTCQSCGRCLQVCPGYSIEYPDGKLDDGIGELNEAWGTILEVWEGFACAPEIRFRASSGGVITAISQYCIEQEQCSGALHIQADPKIPWNNTPVYSCTKEELLHGTGSRYAPAAVCQAFHMIQKADRPSVFVGKPCDVAALRKYEMLEEGFGLKVHCALSLFCAGTPSKKGSDSVLEALEVDSDQVKSIRYRGHGWPGSFTARLNSGEERTMSYRQAWDTYLTPSVQWGCRLCPDHTGQFADISCGDPWYRTFPEDEPGRSLILVRTQKGSEILKKASEKGYIQLERATPQSLFGSQVWLYRNRKELFGRLLALKLMRMPCPQFYGFQLYKNYIDLPFRRKLRSVVGTLKRIITRGYYQKSKEYSR